MVEISQVCPAVQERGSGRDREVIGGNRGDNRDCLLYRREYINAIFRF